MNIEITQTNLQRALSLMSRVASSKTDLPILSNVLIDATNEEVSLSATNLEVAVIYKVPAKISDPGKIAVPARLFHEFVSQLPKDNIVKLSFEGNKLFIKSDNYSSHIQSSLADDFPSLPEITKSKPLVVSSQILQSTLTKTVIASSNDETRPVLGGVYVHSHEGKLFFTATDGYRLAEMMGPAVEVEIESIVPSQALQEVLKMNQDSDSDNCELFFGDGQFAVKAGQTQLISRLVDGDYPEYRKLIPEKSSTVVQVDKNEFQTASKLAGLFARESGGSITIKANEAENNIVIASVASQVGDNNSAVDAEVSGNDSVVVNVRYLNDALNCFDANKITFRFGDSIAPCVLSSKEQPGYQHIVMPLKS